MKLFRILLVLCLSLSGCSAQQEAETLVGKTASEPNFPPIVQAVEIEAESTDEEPAEDTAGAEEQATQPLGTFESPFPDRVELFVSPKRQGRGIIKTPDGNENSVELLGFVRVKDQRVVLSIDGLVSPLAVGSQERGIEVISIQPPVAVLQRGRQRWQVSLEN